MRCRPIFIQENPFILHISDSKIYLYINTELLYLILHALRPDGDKLHRDVHEDKSIAIPWHIEYFTCTQGNDIKDIDL